MMEKNSGSLASSAGSDFMTSLMILVAKKNGMKAMSTAGIALLSRAVTPNTVTPIITPMPTIAARMAAVLAQ